MVWYKPWTWFGDDSHPCNHPRTTFDDDFDSYWYEAYQHDGHTYWCEYNATYVKLRSVLTLYVCKYCGSTKTIGSAERVGGPQNIIRKQDIEDGVMPHPPHDVCTAKKREIDWSKDRERLHTGESIFETMQRFAEQAERDERFSTWSSWKYPDNN